MTQAAFIHLVVFHSRFDHHARRAIIIRLFLETRDLTLQLFNVSKSLRCSSIAIFLRRERNNDFLHHRSSTDRVQLHFPLFLSFNGGWSFS